MYTKQTADRLPPQVAEPLIKPELTLSRRMVPESITYHLVKSARPLVARRGRRRGDERRPQSRGSRGSARRGAASNRRGGHGGSGNPWTWRRQTESLPKRSHRRSEAHAGEAHLGNFGRSKTPARNARQVPGMVHVRPANTAIVHRHQVSRDRHILGDKRLTDLGSVA